MQDLDTIVLLATSTQGRIIKATVKGGINPVQLVEGLNDGSLELVGSNTRVVNNRGESVALIDGIEEDASGTEFLNFSLEDEGCTPLEGMTDRRLAQLIADLRGLIDGESQDGLGEMLTPHLGILLAEQAKRGRQRS